MTIQIQHSGEHYDSSQDGKDKPCALCGETYHWERVEWTSENQVFICRKCCSTAFARDVAVLHLIDETIKRLDAIKRAHNRCDQNVDDLVKAIRAYQKGGTRR
jgi:hypothetical protein